MYTKRPRDAAPVPSMLCLCESRIPDTMGMFPIGTVAPDGVSFVSEEGKIYTALMTVYIYLGKR